MRVAVLGGNGLLGKHLVPLLTEAGHEVTLASRLSETRADLATGEGPLEAVPNIWLALYWWRKARNV